MRPTAPYRRRVLFLAYWFPPVQAVASLRTYNIVSQLSRRGWDITVVTPSPEIWRTVDQDGRSESLASRSSVRRVSTGHRWRLLCPEHLVSWNRGIGHLAGGIARKIAAFLDIERQAGWLTEARAACDSFRPGDFDLVLASGGPFVSFCLAKELSQRLGCPYVLDYRDLWTGNPHAGPRHRNLTVQRELRIIKGSAAVTAVSPSLREYLYSRFGGDERPSVIWNGYDADELAGVQPHCFDHFAIVYAGIFYIPVSTVEPLMAALGRLRDLDGSRWRFHYFGPQGAHVRESAGRHGILDRIVDHGVVSRKVVLSATLGAQVASVITSVKPEATLEERGIVTGKIFEPLGLGTPILLVAPPTNDAVTIVRATGVGGSFHGGEIDGITAFLRTRMDAPGRRAKVPDRYSWDSLGEELDDILSRARHKAQTPERTRAAYAHL